MPRSMRRKELIATVTCNDIAEMDDCLYQPYSTPAPVWTIGGSYYTVCTLVELKKFESRWEWKEVQDSYVDQLTANTKWKVYRHHD
jgi:hypothetical protein